MTTGNYNTFSNGTECKSFPLHSAEKTQLERIDESIRRTLDHPHVLLWVSLILIAGTLWGILYSITEEFCPGTQLFSLAALFVSAYVAGELISLIHLPPLLGMLVMGLALRNSGVVHFTGVYPHVNSILREIALFIILTRAGLGLDPKALKNLSLIIIRLSLVPALVEGILSMVLTHYLLGLPWIWGALLGSILAAVSPAVVIPCLFSLQERGYGTDKGIPTLVVAAASLDDIFSISVFGVLISMIFSPGSSLTMQIIRGPVGVVMGIAFGIVWGVVLHYVPHKDDRHAALLRVLLISAGGLMVIFGSDMIGYPGAGPLGCIVAPFVASLGWEKDGWEAGKNPVADVFGVVWLIFQPILFGLIGSEVDVSVLDAGTVALGFAALLGSLSIRLLVCVFIAFGGGFTWKEKLFTAWAWFPKATVQAALGPIPLDKVRDGGSPEEIGYAEKILVLSVLAILITAPLGAILITLLGPKLLSKSPTSEMSRINSKTQVENKTSSEIDIDLT